MLINILLAAHIIVVGYWLGADLCINSTFRYVSRRASLPFEERAALLEHVLDIDQHVRYALVLQVGLGTALASLFGYLPGAGVLAAAAGIGAVTWLALVEITHRLREAPIVDGLARLDRSLRYLLIVTVLVLAGAAWLGYSRQPGWLALKLALLAGAVCCGLGIRFELIRYFRVWHEIEREGSTDAREKLLWSRYVSATGVLVALWVFIAGIVALSVIKP